MDKSIFRVYSLMDTYTFDVYSVIQTLIYGVSLKMDKYCVFDGCSVMEASTFKVSI